MNTSGSLTWISQKEWPFTLTYRYTLHPLLCKGSRRLGLISNNSGFGPLRMLWNILLVHFERLLQWGPSMGFCTSSLGDPSRVSLVYITCITQDSHYFEMPFWLLSSAIWKMVLYCLLAVPSSLTLAVSSLSHAPAWSTWTYQLPCIPTAEQK